MFLGPEKLVDTAKRVGIKAKLEPNPSLALGTGGMSILDLARGYNTFATGGYKKEVNLIKRVEDSEGNVLYEKKDFSEFVLNENYTYILNEMLTTTTNSQFKDYTNPTCLSIASKLSRKYAVKTGSSSKDYLIAGYNPDILMITWVGYDDNRDTSSADSYRSRNIWADTVEDLQRDQEAHWYETPDNVVGVVLDSVSGKTTNDTKKATLFYYVKGTENDISNAEKVFKEENIQE